MTPSLVLPQYKQNGTTIERFVNRRAANEGGSANVINTVEGDLDRDGDADVVVNYAVEGVGGGGNITQLYVAVFLNHRGRLSFKTETIAGMIGTGYGRLLNVRGIESGSVICEALEYLPDDSVCCPAGKSMTSLVLEQGKLLERRK